MGHPFSWGLRQRRERVVLSHPVAMRLRQGWGQPQPGYLFERASTPGSFLPSRNSRLAPPPVEMWVILSATPAWLMAETESPPPMMEVADLLAATARAMALVPMAK